MAREMVKKQGKVRFCLSCNYFSTLLFFLVNLKNLQTSACLNLNYGINKQKPNIFLKVANMVEFMTRVKWAAGGLPSLATKIKVFY